MGLLKRMITIFLPVALFQTEKNVEKVLKTLAGHGAEDFKATKIYNHWRLLIKNFKNSSLRFHKRIAFSEYEFRKIKNRLIFIVGDNDRLAYFPESIRAIKTINLNNRIIKDAGHTANYEKAEEVNKEIINFLEIPF